MESTQATDGKLQEAYDALPKGSCSRHHVETVLRLKPSEYDTLIPTIEGLLDAYGVTGYAGLLGITGAQRKKDISNILRNDPKHRDLLQRALDDCEDEAIFGRALAKLIVLVNSARKKRFGRKVKKSTINPDNSPPKAPLTAATPISKAPSPIIGPSPTTGPSPIIDRMPQEPLDVIMCYNDCKKLIASLASITKDEEVSEDNESEIAAKDLSFDKLKIEAAELFDDAVPQIGRNFYFRCKVKSVACNIKSQRHLMGVAQRIAYSKSHLHLEIVSDKGKF